MGELMLPFVVAMVPTINGKIMSDTEHPTYLIKPKNAANFKATWDGMPEGMEYITIENVMDLRGSFPRALP